MIFFVRNKALIVANEFLIPAKLPGPLLTYNVEIDSTAIKDNAGNYFAGISGTTYQINSKLVDTTAPYITSGPSVSSNNSYNTLLTSSDTLTLIFTTNETINTPTIVINNQTISSGNISNSGNTWTATYSPQATHPVGPIDYYITYVDSAGNSSRQPSSGTTTINIALATLSTTLLNE